MFGDLLDVVPLVREHLDVVLLAREHPDVAFLSAELLDFVPLAREHLDAVLMTWEHLGVAPLLGVLGRRAPGPRELAVVLLTLLMLRVGLPVWTEHTVAALPGAERVDRSQGVPADVITYSAASSAFVKSTQWQR